MFGKSVIYYLKNNFFESRSEPSIFEKQGWYTSVVRFVFSMGIVLAQYAMC